MDKEKTWANKIGYVLGFTTTLILLLAILVGSFKLLLYLWYL